MDHGHGDGERQRAPPRAGRRTVEGPGRAPGDRAAQRESRRDGRAGPEAIEQRDVGEWKLVRERGGRVVGCPEQREPAREAGVLTRGAAGDPKHPAEWIQTQDGDAARPHGRRATERPVGELCDRQHEHHHGPHVDHRHLSEHRQAAHDREQRDDEVVEPSLVEGHAGEVGVLGRHAPDRQLGDGRAVEPRLAPHLGERNRERHRADQQGRTQGGGAGRDRGEPLAALGQRFGGGGRRRRGARPQPGHRPQEHRLPHAPPERQVHGQHQRQRRQSETDGRERPGNQEPLRQPKTVSQVTKHGDRRGRQHRGQ